MCGIAGILTPRGETAASLLDATRRMTNAIAHRGPNDAGAWIDPDAGVSLGHRRLSIVDLSAAGHQPMVSACGRYTVVYNGEIYNHRALREGLPGVAWRGHSDTETMLALFSRDGIEATLSRLVGMFAIAVWDRAARALTLARDRMGEKPLYFGRLPSGETVFGSELAALRAHPRWDGEIDRDALALFMRHNAVPAPHSIHRGIAKLEPGCWARIARDGTTAPGRYWDVRDVAARGRAAPLDASVGDDEATDRLETLLGDAVAGQMVADVPLGAFLSGGVDSSAIVALMAARARRPVRTFTIGFDEPGFNEAEHAKAVARHLGTDHTELYVGAADALAVIPELPRIYDEPFADSSQVPTFLVARMARQHVTVALSGDGGDELFTGYNRYLLADRVWQRLHGVPLGLRRAAAGAALALAPGAWDALAAPVQALRPAARRVVLVGDKVHKFAAHALPAADAAAMYRSLVSHWQAPEAIVLGAREPRSRLDEPWDGDAALDPSGFGAVERMALLDQQTYLPDDILVKVDRASMAVSLETRAPLLDHRVVEFAWSLPRRLRLRDGRTKWLLRRVLDRHVPRALIDRPKQGFAMPIGPWLRGPLRDWAESLLDERRLREEGFFDVALLRRHWHEHLTGRRNWQYQLWDALMFQAWLSHLRAAPTLASAVPRQSSADAADPPTMPPVAAV